jgi:hypothetical protein
MDYTGGRPDLPGIPERGITEILQAGFELYQKYWKELMAIAAVVIVPVTIVQYFLLHQLAAKAELVTRNGHVTLVVSNGFWRREIALALFSLLTVLIYQVLTGAITRAVASDTVGTPLSTEDSYRFAMARLGPIIVVGILAALAALAGFILFIIPGIWIAVRLSVSTPALIVENKQGSMALRRSWDLVRGRWWQVFGTFLVAGIIAGLVSSVLALPFGHNWFLRSIGAIIGSIVTLPFSTSVLVLIYLDLRARKENLDVATLRSELEASGV